MPIYSKFLKDIMSQRRKLEDVKTVALTQECSAIIQNKLPPKLNDPGSFSIPCTIGTTTFKNALCDLGASVSLLPLSVSQELNMGELKATTISLQLADESVTYPSGILENVPIKVGKFYVPVNFVVLDMEEDKNIPIILGRPFLATSGAIIDVKFGRITFKIGDDEEEFKLATNSKPPEVNIACQVAVVDENLKQHSMVLVEGMGQVDEVSIKKSLNENEEVPFTTSKSCPPKPPPKDSREVPKKKKKKKIKDKVLQQVLKLIWVVKPPKPPKQANPRKQGMEGVLASYSPFEPP